MLCVCWKETENLSSDVVHQYSPVGGRIWWRQAGRDAPEGASSPLLVNEETLTREKNPSSLEKEKSQEDPGLKRYRLAGSTTVATGSPVAARGTHTVLDTFKRLNTRGSEESPGVVDGWGEDAFLRSS